MEYNIVKLYNDCSIAIEHLNSLEETNDEYENTFKSVTNENGAISKFLKCKIKLYNERRLLMEKYENKLNSPFKNEIIAQIRAEVRKKYPRVGVKELLYFSTNVYIYTTLLAYKVSEQEIIEQLIPLNNIFFKDMQESGELVQKYEIDSDLEYFKYLKEKYTKIIKERI